MNKMEIVNVTPDNAEQETFFCIKDIKSPGFKSKQRWFKKQYVEGLRLKILRINEKMVGFIEFVPAKKAWRPINAPDFMFIQCITVYSKKDRKKGYATLLIEEAIKEAKALGLSGICTMTSKGAWIANNDLFKKNGFNVLSKKERFELLSKKWNEDVQDPELIDWTENQKEYNGWYLVYADQCPWHEKSAFDLLNTAMDYGIDLNIKKIESVKQAKQAPSGFGVFSLLHDGKLLEDHYISATRFRNILKKQLHN